MIETIHCPHCNNFFNALVSTNNEEVDNLKLEIERLKEELEKNNAHMG